MKKEVHSFQLGIFGGILVSILLYRGYVRTGLGVLAVCFVFSLGFPDGELFCSTGTDSCFHRPVQTKPHYFDTGLFATVLLVPAAARVILGPAVVDVFEPFRSDLDAVRAQLAEAGRLEADASDLDVLRALVDEYDTTSLVRPGALQLVETASSDDGTADDTDTDSDGASSGDGPGRE